MQQLRLLGRPCSWQRERQCALPESDYLAVTFTMANTLWPLFAANPRLRRKLPEIAARVVMNYARVRKGAEVGVIPILQTFNGKLEFNPHVHALVTAKDLLSADARVRSNIYFVDIKLTRSWQRLVIALLRRALEAGQLRSVMERDEIDHLLQQEENREWAWTHVHRDTKEHFLRYGGRYVLRPPISENRILDTAEGLYGSARSDAELMGGSVGAGVSESTYGQAMRGSRYGAEAACIY
jgi:hypothetical protein